MSKNIQNFIYLALTFFIGIFILSLNHIIDAMNAAGVCGGEAQPLTVPASRKSERRDEAKALFRKWVNLLAEIKESGDLPRIALTKVLKFYRENVGKDVYINVGHLSADFRLIAYKINLYFGRIRFYTINGLEISFEWNYYGYRLVVVFDHLARSEVYA